MGFSGRLVIEDSSKPKWKHMGRKTGWVYPFYVEYNGEAFVRDAIMSTREVFLVESIGDMLSLHEHGVTNVLVTFGLDVSSRLCCLLSTLNLNKIHLSLNNDLNSSENRGLNACVKNALKLLNLVSIDKLDITLPLKNDFGDMESADFDIWLNDIKDKKREDFIEETLAVAHKLKAEKKLPQTLLKNVKFIC